MDDVEWHRLSDDEKLDWLRGELRQLGLSLNGVALRVNDLSQDNRDLLQRVAAIEEREGT